MLASARVGCASTGPDNTESLRARLATSVCQFSQRLANQRSGCLAQVWVPGLCDDGTVTLHTQVGSSSFRPLPAVGTHDDRIHCSETYVDTLLNSEAWDSRAFVLCVALSLAVLVTQPCHQRLKNFEHCCPMIVCISGAHAI